MDTLLIDHGELGIATITLNRPERLNAINHAMLRELEEALRQIDRDQTVRVVVLTGAGRGFCSGADNLARREDGPPPETLGLEKVRAYALGHHFFWSKLAEQLMRLRVPVIAAINGPVAGIGLALCLGADIRIASDAAVFHNGFAKLGLGPTEGGISWLLPRLIGMSRATDIILTGRPVAADEAYGIGLVSKLVTGDALMRVATETAAMIAANNAFGTYLSKETLWANLSVADFSAAVRMEVRGQIMTLFSDEVRHSF